ncbi:Aromatic/aminoadipate aminotransferase 1 [Friedmanniomyces endolithicus]|uniref:Phospho-2-dehydro-3-deoxyheptonate aldolase n=1 Tax=Friedmanniomyces endolithicus TaxID=329885 RepID=A0AAN6F7H6_9PEZI|nr:Aromatic/aminoadipate aminotransferase 1 [Friedmanniomyces endolithicus]KAK0273628.1 Aromatic/aminoadipate aminotransferase 1 [Friedmanniomyces endolithicus]KAK0305959.1 Aromatic/aminoadipate aminotransferase 1 [Friedmanniomyces endolithicus]KAK0977651.1 Aromatic/aminoadipate aminotransferase 1 [Friedmanniomyces endolithicus]KAK0981959.1 Aromatic/aminoadipate aminotransferase 1 [Friedmanniomyces endolithicus]
MDGHVANKAISNGTSHSDWSPSSWRTKPIKQPVNYEDQALVDKATAKLRRLPPIVTPTEIWKLRRALAEVAQGKAFLLQGGDCAELFDYCNDQAIDSKVKLLLQMSLVLIWGGNKPVVRIARMAGQYAKPRSSPMEAVDGKQMPSFRGDILNGYPSDQRAIDPDRLVQAYFHSAATLNYLRAQLASGIADLHNPMEWELGHVGDPELQQKYTKIVESISESLRFMRTVGADTAGQLETVDLFTSHEGLLLEYEEALTRKLKHPSNRNVTPTPKPAPKVSPLTGGALLNSSIPQDPETTGHYNTSAHFLWVGDRTRQPDHAHIEYFRGIENPIGIKVGPTTTPADLTRLLDIVDPRRETGKVTLITRYGAAKVAELLPQHIAAVRQTGHTVVWQCDPMHGNTRSTTSGIKTRSFAAIFSELAAALRIHRACGSILGGVHLELTGDAVTECTGGSEGLQDEDLGARYETFCDPRLNEKQALEIAFLVAGSQRGTEG